MIINDGEQFAYFEDDVKNNNNTQQKMNSKVKGAIKTSSIINIIKIDDC